MTQDEPIVTQTPEHTFPYQFCLGTSGVMVNCLVTVRNGQRFVSEIIYTKAGMMFDEPPERITQKQARRVWAHQQAAQWTKRTLDEEIERITQAHRS